MKTQELLQQVNSRIPEDSGINAFIKNAFLGEEIIVSRNGLSLSIAEGWGIYEILLKQDGKRIHYAEISKRQPDYPETILKYVDWLMPETQETMATGGGVEDRMYNFLKDDLKELEKAIREGNNEEVERFFSYWGYHLKSLKMAQGGSMAQGGGVENSLILIEPTAERNGVEVRKTKNDINSAELRKVSVSGRDNGYIASVTKSGSVIISGSSWRGKMVNSPVDMTIVEEKVKENLPQIIKIIETYSSGGSMAIRGGLIGEYNREESWEKQTIFNLNNDSKITVEYNPFYGELVSRIDMPDGTYWHSSSGLSGLPEFAKSWIEPISKGHWDKIVRPKFEKKYSSGGSMATGGQIKYPKERLDVIEQSRGEIELELFIDNDGDLYRYRVVPIHRNLITKIAQGKFDINLAPKIYMYLIEAGQEKYIKENEEYKEYGIPLTKPQKENLAKEYVNRFLDEASYGNYDNYLPEKYRMARGGGVNGLKITLSKVREIVSELNKERLWEEVRKEYSDVDNDTFNGIVYWWSEGKQPEIIFHNIMSGKKYSSGGSMAIGGGINEDSYTEYSIIGDEIEEHFDDEDSLRDYYNNLTKEEQRSVQMFSKEWNNEDGRWVEGEVIIIKNKDELLKFGGSMATGGGMGISEKYDEYGLYKDINTFQLWSPDIMLTAQLSREDAIKGLNNGNYFLISGQAVGIKEKSSGGSMAAGGEIYKQNDIKYLREQYAILSHQLNDDELLEYANLMKKYKFQTQLGQFTNEDYSRLKTLQEKFANGGSMARGGGISDELQLSKGDYIVPSKEYEKEGWKPMKIIQVKGDMVSVEYDDGTKGEQFLRSLISRIKYGYLKIKSCYEMARGGNIIWIGDKIRVLKGIYGDYRHPKYANKEFYIIDMRDGKYIDTRSEDGVSETFSIKDEGETFERIIMAKGGRVHQHKSGKKMSWGGEIEEELEPYQQIVKELKKANIDAEAKYFDKYQGVYIKTDKDKFWTKEFFTRGEKIKTSAKYSRAVLYDSEGISSSATKGDYFAIPKEHILKGSELILTTIQGKKIKIKDPKVSDLPDLTEVESTFEFKKGSETGVFILYPEKEPELEIEVSVKDKKVDASQLIDYIKE